LDRRRNVLVCPDLDALSREAAGLFARAVEESVARSGRFTVALAGGSTPRRLYELLALEPWLGRVPWEKVHVFFGDERCVPPEHPDSNYRMTREALLDRVPLPPENVRRMEGERPAEEAARRYEAGLREFFGLATDELPRLDLVLLGLGPDGHTASLFPGTAALGERRRIVVANRVDKLGSDRLTLTVPALNASRRVVFLVSGAEKASVLHEVLDGPDGRYPAQLVNPPAGEVIFLVDHAASAARGGRS
jgi:6-phosphogluconolactonase